MAGAGWRDVVLRRWWHADLRDDDHVLFGRLSGPASSVAQLCAADPERYLQARRMLWLQIVCGLMCLPAPVFGFVGLDPRLPAPWWSRPMALVLILLLPTGLHMVCMPLAWWRWSHRHPRLVRALR